MPSPPLTRLRTPMDDVPIDTFRELAEFVRRVAPRWLDGSRSLNRPTMPPCPAERDGTWSSSQLLRRQRCALACRFKPGHHSAQALKRRVHPSLR